MYQRFTMFSCAVSVALCLPCPGFCTSEECVALKSTSAASAVDYLEHQQGKTAECAKAAFQLISHLPHDDAIPILIKHLGYKRPLTDAERHGFLIHGPLPEVLYPAVESLYEIGLPAELPLMDFVAQNERKDSVERKNALYALVMIRHSDMVPLIKAMHERSLSLAGTPGSRLESAA